MRIYDLFEKRLLVALLFIAASLIAVSLGTVNAQTRSNPTSSDRTTQRPTAGSANESRSSTFYRENVHCAGFIEYGASYRGSHLEIVGGEEEQNQRTYVEGDYVYINSGAQQGMRVGQEFSIIRPRTLFTTEFTKKDGFLGVYTQELGKLRITNVMDRVSVAIIETACDTIVFGDFLRAVPQRDLPQQRPVEGNLDRFAPSSGKQTGRIVLARGGREMVTTNDVVYIDLGTQDGIKAGDSLTIYRRLGRGNITRFRDDNISPSTSGGFESDIFKGGKYSNQAPRSTRPDRTGIHGGPVESIPDVVERRPRMPRKIVGELIVTDVKERTATAIITRIAQEVHTGDFVELQ